MKSRFLFPIIALIASFFFTALFFYATNLLPHLDLTYSYSSDHAFRWQTDALLSGHISLSNDPKDIEIDTVFYNGKVQQVWGLGVPLLQLPFQAILKVFHFKEFPDRLILWFYFNLTFYITTLSFIALFREQNYSKLRSLIFSLSLALCVFFVLPIFSLARIRFLVYEESVFYAYLAAVLLFCGSIHTKPHSKKWLIILSFLSGLSALIRPTVIFYGGASIIIALKRSQASKGKIILSGIAFAVGTYIVLLFNLLRFGNLFEFGHGLNVSLIPELTYYLKFHNTIPYLSTLTASKNLLGFTFFQYPYLNFIKTSWWQSQSLPWIEVYFTTFSVLHLGAWIIAIGIYFVYVIKKYFKFPTDFYLWSLISFVSTFIFYIYVPSLSSRYSVDFAAAVIIGIVGLIIDVSIRLSYKKIYLAYSFLILSVFITVGFIILDLHHEPSHRTSLKYKNTLKTIDASFSVISYQYSQDDNLFSYGIFPNGVGWDTHTGVTNSIFIVYIKDPQYFKLTFIGDKNTFPSFYKNLEIKIGNDYIFPLRYDEKSLGVFEVAFNIPAYYQTNTWPVFVKVLPLEKNAEKNTDFKLIHIQWRDS